ncbi:CoA-binding domain protein [Leptospira yanagawae serovar Saopaulo str. Sao Paulo = ATCC 700523]|uniref:CoA-binding domain protein n=1 Tax=Leptospira yanagawae serovar Saopaulo str. Sao Paulo = ATCC 700523 TaxID=1249483 RepID=A0A5E8HCL4_9LEPT|nr:CoA-binding protein [Leptospira yanagawae]EOQ88612.1 CoA-binding domain protein [Leptospira yanagawae serovar Saopaulo str. Sao Paulo = ATCC 700523]
MNVPDSEIKTLLESYKTITVYGLSNDKTKPSHYVPVFMRDKGWRIIGTYPKEHDVGGFSIFKNLVEIPKEDRKFIDVFRSSDKIPEVVDEILKLGGTEVLWLQLGISHPEAEKKAEQAGIKVVSNRCLIIEYNQYF